MVRQECNNDKAHLEGQLIRSVWSQQFGNAPPTYVVELASRSGQLTVFRGLRRQEIATYHAFQVACALQGVYVEVGEIESLPRTGQRVAWLKVLSRGVAAWPAPPAT